MRCAHVLSSGSFLRHQLVFFPHYSTFSHDPDHLLCGCGRACDASVQYLVSPTLTSRVAGAAHGRSLFLSSLCGGTIVKLPLVLLFTSCQSW
ncbi:hypothetical protein RRG08_020793 [Elysia crispata]|uniref:Uncharacterized protein n=1 Tax=Elysia crispata TaxID=231223 RepID=A0AAE1DMR8_9GAST|nr:hypothetical protein RRG08_020793 [Elysia crispata]